MTKNIYTIPPAAPFIERLAAGLWEQAGRDPFKLSEMQVLLPTRRACRYLREAFPRVANAQATLLPRMQPLGDLDEAELYFTGGADLNPAIPPAIASMRRQLLLARLVRQRDPSMPLDQAAQLAEALARLLDQVQIEHKDFSGLEKLVEGDLALHWQKTVKFLEIVTKAWPVMLAEEGCIDPADRRNRVIEAQAAAWRAKPPAHPIIAAGSTGSLPATGDLLEVIAGLPQGAVVLPGLDQELEEAWQSIEENHPQFSMKYWLEKAGVKRDAVKLWPACEKKSSPRARLLQESMRPAEVSEGWRHLDAKKIPRTALKGLSCLVLDNAQEEAQTIALLLREALETKDKTAALVTADRGLAERVAQELARWDIKINDSAGTSLAAQPVGSFLLDVLAVAAPGAGAVDYLSLLKHPLAACGLDPALCRARAREAEISIWRAHDPQAKDIHRWFDQLKQKWRGSTDNWKKNMPLLDRLRAHIELAEHLAATDKEKGATRLWAGEDGEKAADWLDEWQSAAAGFPPLTGDEYLGLSAGLMRAVKVTSVYGLHPRLSIVGLLEARLLQPDLVILGGLNEGSWPPEAEIDPWMSRPMKKQFGLPLPEWRIGFSAHDFVQLASAPDVVLTRSRRAGNAPTVPSRFLLQLETVLRALGYQDGENALPCDQSWIEWARQLDEPAASPTPCSPPAPRPPAAARPRSLSVTQIGTWRRNPYAIYARCILELEKLEPLESAADAADKGQAIHMALEKFMHAYPDKLPANAFDELIKCGREAFAPLHDEPQAMAFWWPRFERIADWFIENEQARRASGIKNLQAEAKGQVTLGKDFTLKGRADRIDRLPDGTLAIVDYKTGSVPKQFEVKSGLEPQLSLLALIAKEGGFKNIPAALASEIAYWKLSGGAQPAEECPINAPVDELVKSARAGLENLIARFADPNTPYLAVPKPGIQPHYNDYAHLSRLAEWGRTAEET